MRSSKRNITSLHNEHRLAGRLLRKAMLTALVGAFSLCSLAVADPIPTQPQYVAHLEAICKPHALITQCTMKGIKPLVRADASDLPQSSSPVQRSFSMRPCAKYPSCHNRMIRSPAIPNHRIVCSKKDLRCGSSQRR